MAKNKPQAGPADYVTTAKPKAYASGVPVFCAHDAIVPISELVPNPQNPNQHPQEQIKLLGYTISATGWRGPITVSTRSGMIVKGHGRLMAAELYDLKEAPVDYQDYASAAEELADLTADNRIAELASTDNKMLAELFAEIDTGEIPFILSGYTEEEYGNIVTALSEALHEDDDGDTDNSSEEDPAAGMVRPGDIWIIGDESSDLDAELLDHISAALPPVKSSARMIVVEVAPKTADAALWEIFRSSGTDGVRCVRQGRELAPEIIAEILPPDVEGGGRE